MNFNVDFFGKELRLIRTNIGLTLKEVSDLTGINTETIRRLESGKVIPKFETLESLSILYKQDLSSLFLTYRIDDFSSFYAIKNSLESKIDSDQYFNLDIDLNRLKALIKYIDNTFLKNHINQLILLISGIILYKNNDEYNNALNTLIEALHITTPKFTLENYKAFVYSSMEVRVLMNIAFILNKLNNKTKYEDIMNFCINSVESDDNLYPKLCHNLAGVYRRNENYKKALEISQLGISAAQKNKNYNGLHLLYYGKGLAAFHLGNLEYETYFNTSIILCDALGHSELKNTIIKHCNSLQK